MTDAEREALVERMAIAAINARRAALGAPPVTDNVAEWLRTAPQRTTEIEAMRAALSAAEPVVREDAAKVLDARVAEIRADQAYWGGPDTTNGAVLIPELEARAAAIRARGAADDGR